MFCVLSSLPVIINKDQKRKDQMSPSTFSFKLVAWNHWCTCYVESKSDSINLTWSTITFRINNIAALLVLFLYYPIINSKYAISKEHVSTLREKVSAFAVMLVRIFPHSDWIRRHIWENTDHSNSEYGHSSRSARQYPAWNCENL